MSRNVLCIAYHFPPFAGSSGVQRSLRFTQYLPENGWEPVVLTVWSKVYEGTSSELLQDIPKGISIYRAPVLDTKRHLGISGRYPSVLALPDRWVSWVISGVVMGLSAIFRKRPKVIWSTYPIASAHVIAYILHRLTGLPWVADFRDPMVEYIKEDARWAPQDNKLRKARLWVERLAVRNASALVFCTETALEICRQRNSAKDDQRYQVIPNGFDEHTFQSSERYLGELHKEISDPLVIIHSGVLYGGTDRDPVPLLHAIRNLRVSGKLETTGIRVVFRGSGAESNYLQLLTDLDLKDIVEFKPACGYQESITEMILSEGLLVLQGYTSNPAIPAKVYEYLRAGRPILALVDDKGETASLLRNSDACILAQPNSIEDIECGFMKFIELVRARQGKRIVGNSVAQYSRQALTARLGDMLSDISEGTFTAAVS